MFSYLLLYFFLFLVSFLFFLICSTITFPHCLTSIISITVNTTERLNIYLDSNAFITDFALTSDGYPGIVEVTNQVQIGDQLLGVNNQSFIKYKNLAQIIQALYDAPLPRTLYFCKNETISAGTTIKQYLDSEDDLGMNGTGYIKLSSDKRKMIKYYPGRLALYSPFTSSNCEEKSIVIATKNDDACKPFKTNLGGEYVLVMSTASCSIDQRAIMVQESNGDGVIITSPMGDRLVRYKLDEVLRKQIHIPVVSISHEVGMTLFEILKSQTSDSFFHISLLFDPICLAKEKEIKENFRNIESLADHQNQLKNVKAGMIRLVNSHQEFLFSVDFLAVASSSKQTSLTIQYYKLKVLANDTCSFVQQHSIISPSASATILSPTSSKDYFSWFILAPLGQCYPLSQILVYQNLRASGIIFYEEETENPFATQKSILDDINNDSQIKIPIITISSSASALIINATASNNKNETADIFFIQFLADNLYYQHWEDLNQLYYPQNWPSKRSARRKIYYRMIKLFQQYNTASPTTITTTDATAVGPNTASSANNNEMNLEKYTKLEEYYHKAKLYYEHPNDQVL